MGLTILCDAFGVRLIAALLLILIIEAALIAAVALVFLVHLILDDISLLKNYHPISENEFKKLTQKKDGTP